MQIPSLSSHILDQSTGRPAINVKVLLERQLDDLSFQKIAKSSTNEDGRVSEKSWKNFNDKELFPISNPSNCVIYRVTLFTEAYFVKNNIDSLYPFIQIVLKFNENEPYHIPLLLSPFGYSTYRGS
mmetsp:Transcript_5681/g.8378  ORF Transcript_5681/g.8378 Transcript_5681/m.8378 type:complete len:126 (-) Transcript_5681:346-723(-)